MATITVDKKDMLEALIRQSNETIADAKDFLQKNGVPYHLGEWLTPKRYCQKFGIAHIQTITNWIRRGVIPPENIVVLPELNNLKLIKAIPYVHEP